MSTADESRLANGDAGAELQEDENRLINGDAGTDLQVDEHRLMNVGAELRVDENSVAYVHSCDMYHLTAQSSMSFSL